MIEKHHIFYTMHFLCELKDNMYLPKQQSQGYWNISTDIQLMRSYSHIRI